MATRTREEAAQVVRRLVQRPKGNGSEFRQGTVSHIDAGGTAWVVMAGDSEPSPCKVDASCKSGDTVTVRVTPTGRAYVAENTTDPAASRSMFVEAKDAADEALEVATATSQHFWSDDIGAHVTDVTKREWKQAEETGFEDESKPYFNSLWNSLGMLFRTALTNLVSITRSAIAFYDGEGNGQGNVVASFGKDGAVLGRDAEPHVGVTKDEVAFYDGEGELERNKVSRISEDGARFGRVTDMHAQTGDSGFYVLNGTDEFLKVEGTVSGQPIEADDYEGHPTSVHALEFLDHQGDMRPYHVYGAYELEPGQGISDAAQAWHDAGNEDDVNVVPMEPAWVWVDTPLGEPNPDLWILTDGELSGVLLEISDAAKTLSAFAGQSVAFGADEELVPPDGEPMAWYERLTGDEYGDVTEGAATRTYFKLHTSAGSLGAYVVIASAYRARDGRVETSGDIYEGGVKLADKYAAKGEAGTSDYEALTNKPSIEGVTLQGDKSFPDLGIFIEPEEPYPQSDDYALTTQEITALWNIVQGGANG